MSAVLHVLGAGSILPREGYGCAGYALRPEPGGPVTLLDCGPGSVRALAGAGIRLEEVRRVVLSHYHLDHCLDLFALAFARRNPRFDPVPRLDLRGPPGLARLVGEAPRALGRWAQDPDAAVHEVEPDAGGRGGFEAEDARFECARTGHTPEAVAWRVTLPAVPGGRGERVLAYTGDTGPNPAVAELARGADLFVAECSFPDEHPVPHHLTPTSAARLARDAEARSCLLTHFYPETDPARAAEVAARTYAGEIQLARDGSSHPLG